MWGLPLWWSCGAPGPWRCPREPGVWARVVLARPACPKAGLLGGIADMATSLPICQRLPGEQKSSNVTGMSTRCSTATVTVLLYCTVHAIVGG